jgi:polysaccharide deacetylase family protein (PEP-CTERM system associated)
MLNAMTVDVEEHFQVSGFSRVVDSLKWESLDSRVEPNTARLLQLFDEAGIEATFFVLGWVAERRGGLVREIASRGHEIACHGYSHKLIYQQDRTEFRSELDRSKKLLEDAAGMPVRGYRAASFSITRRSLWALDELVDAGFAYDSSIFPVVHDRYGIPGAPRSIHRIRTPTGNTILEVPPSTLSLAGLHAPIAGGGYLRMYPRVLTRWALQWLNRVERLPAVVYVHPWEVDVDQPRIGAPWLSRLRHYSRLNATVDKLRDLMQRFAFGSIEQVIDRHPAVLERAAG